MTDVERWTLDHGGRSHVLQVEPAGWGRRMVWSRDGDRVADTKSNDERVHMAPGKDGPTDAGVLTARFGWWGPARRVTLFEAGTDVDAAAGAQIGLGGVDFRPEPGSGAARRQAWIVAHPRLHTTRQTLAAAAAVVLPLLLAWLLARFAFSLPWPDWDLPQIPWPSIPWPSIPWPQIPWPDVSWPQVRWPDLSLPAWVEEVLSYARYVVPVVIAFVLARREIRRHRTQDGTKTARPPAKACEHPATPPKGGERGTD